MLLNRLKHNSRGRHFVGGPSSRSEFRVSLPLKLRRYPPTLGISPRSDVRRIQWESRKDGPAMSPWVVGAIGVWGEHPDSPRVSGDFPGNVSIFLVFPSSYLLLSSLSLPTSHPRLRSSVLPSGSPPLVPRLPLRVSCLISVLLSRPVTLVPRFPVSVPRLSGGGSDEEGSWGLGCVRSPRPGPRGRSHHDS